MDKRGAVAGFNPDRAKFKELVHDAGFKSLSEYCRYIGMAKQTLENNLSGRYGISVQRLIIMATGLSLPVDVLIELFYPELMRKNKEVTTPVESLSTEV